MSKDTVSASGRGTPIRFLILALGAAISVWLGFFSNLQPGSPEVSRTAAIAVLMATLWITEWIPLAATALLPVVLFPVLGIQDGKEVSSAYFNHIVFLFIGGFIVALAMQHCQLHRRIALHILIAAGPSISRLLLGFMLATALLSMWISNTAATMMMVTIASALLLTLKKLNAERPDELQAISHSLLLGTAYAASIGGLSTLVGTPPNLAFAQIFAQTFPDASEVDFLSWMMFAAPISILLFAATWLFLYRVYLQKTKIKGVDRNFLRQQLSEMGPATRAQKIVFGLFSVLVLLWITRNGVSFGSFAIPGWKLLFAQPAFINDGTVAIAIGCLMFFVPSFDKSGDRLMDWGKMKDMPWHIVLLFGGGFALAGAFKASGLSTYIGVQLEGLSQLHPFLLLVAICLLITFLTELTSNLATTEMILPIVAALAVSIDVAPLLLMIPVTISCSCAFMMPVATPPNAIVFGTGQVKIREMVRTGFVLNLIAVTIVTVVCYFLLPLVIGVD